MEHQNKINKSIAIIITVVVATFFVGAGTFMWQENKTQIIRHGYERQIGNLEKILKEANENGRDERDVVREYCQGRSGKIENANEEGALLEYCVLPDQTKCPIEEFYYGRCPAVQISNLEPVDCKPYADLMNKHGKATVVESVPVDERYPYERVVGSMCDVSIVYEKEPVENPVPSIISEFVADGWENVKQEENLNSSTYWIKKDETLVIFVKRKDGGTKEVCGGNIFASCPEGEAVITMSLRVGTGYVKEKL